MTLGRPGVPLFALLRELQAAYAVRATVALVCASASPLLACEGGSHAYVAAPFDRARGCMLPPVGIDVLSGPPAPRTCTAACLNVRGELHVSTECPPYPALAEPSPVDVDCDRALAAYAAGTSCNDGG